MRAVDAALNAQAALLAAATCAGAYTRAMPPQALCYISLFATVLALFMLWRGRYYYYCHVLLTSALCVLCVWGAAFAPSVVRVVWHDGLREKRGDAAASPQNALYAASVVLVVSRLLAQGQPAGLTLLLAAFAIVTLNAAVWDWSATVAFCVAIALAVHLATPPDVAAEPPLDEALARVWGTPAAFALVEALLTRPHNNNSHDEQEEEEEHNNKPRAAVSMRFITVNHDDGAARPAPRTASVWAMGR